MKRIIVVAMILVLASGIVAFAQEANSTNQTTNGTNSPSSGSNSTVAQAPENQSEPSNNTQTSPSNSTSNNSTGPTQGNVTSNQTSPPANNTQPPSNNTQQNNATPPIQDDDDRKGKGNGKGKDDGKATIPIGGLIGVITQPNATPNNTQTNPPVQNATQNTTPVAPTIEPEDDENESVDVNTTVAAPQPRVGDGGGVAVPFDRQEKEDLLTDESALLGILKKDDSTRGKVVVDVTVLTTKPDELPDVPEFVYQYLDIELTNGSQRTYDINFKVSKDWISKNYVSQESITMYRYTDEWVEIPTKIVDEDDSYVYYETTTSGFSYFAIAGERKTVDAKVGMWVLIIMGSLAATASYIYKKVNSDLL